MNGPQSIEEIGERLSGVHEFFLQGLHVVEAMEDDESPSLFVDSFDDGYFFFDAFDLSITQNKIVDLLGESSFIWAIHWNPGTGQSHFRYLVDGQTQIGTAEALQDGSGSYGNALSDIVDDIRSAWREAPGRYQDSAMLALISMSSGAMLSDGWLHSIQNAFVTENLR
jgi:hypothetical protein